MKAERFDVFLVNLDPTKGREIKKTRPCLIVSPDEMNRYILTVMIAPMTTKSHDFPTRVSCKFQGKDGYIVLDQIRTIDKIWLIKRLGKISNKAQSEVLAILNEIFAP
ncbi:type II toxin-antitoxin system PemK/MazF family toxin [candidate division KSB1 bacterium]|nr:type II toxin-antitoxin system PemK/MazF family toxin [candidate division KSB1 bacterium]